MARICNHDECEKRSSFNIEGKINALYCVTHKLNGMINVNSKTCSQNGCKKRPSFNTKGQKKAVYCVAHKLDGMVDIKSKICIYNGCIKNPSYNIKGQNSRLYCTIHKLDGMVNVKHKTCSHDGCEKKPGYNIKGQKKALYCVAHKLNGMVDVQNKTCSHDECAKQPGYNIKGQKKALYCAAHKLNGMVDVISKTCHNDWCLNIVKNKYKGYCLFCYMNMFPDQPVARNYKTKEFAVVEYIKDKYPDFTWKADKIVEDGCSKRRPDLLLDLGYQIIIVEIDENQHTDYDCSCENKRIMEISQDLAHRPIVFVRFNPDSYITQDNQNISSCWGLNTRGICVVKKSKIDEWVIRLSVLHQEIDYWSHPTNKTDKMVEVVQLFYNAN